MAFYTATRLAYALIGAACAFAVAAYLKYDFSGVASMSYFENEKDLMDMAKYFAGTTLLAMTGYYVYFDQLTKRAVAI